MVAIKEETVIEKSEFIFFIPSSHFWDKTDNKCYAHTSKGHCVTFTFQGCEYLIWIIKCSFSAVSSTLYNVRKWSLDFFESASDRDEEDVTSSPERVQGGRSQSPSFGCSHY